MLYVRFKWLNEMCESHHLESKSYSSNLKNMSPNIRPKDDGME